MSSKEGPSIIYKLEGKEISIDNAPANLVGNVLLNMQNLVSSLGSYHEKKGYIDKRKAKITESIYTLSVSFSRGSLALSFESPYEQQIIDETDQSLQGKTFESIYNILSELTADERDNTNAFNKKLSNIVDDPRTIRRVFNYVNELIPKSKEYNAAVNVKGLKIANTKPISLNNPILKRRIDAELSREILESESERVGVIVRVKCDVPNPSYVIKQTDGNLARIYMEDDMKSKIIDYMINKTPVKIRGFGTKKQLFEFYEVDKIDEIKNIEISSVKGMNIPNPILADVSYDYEGDEDFWMLSNKELGINSVGKTLEKAKHMFEEELMSDYEVYKDIPDDKLTEEAKILKNHLLAIF